MNEAHQLFESFAKPEKSEWTKAASAEISGGNPTENLGWVTADKQNFEPFYSPEDVAALSYLQNFQLNGINHTPDAHHWVNLPEVEVNDEKTANQSGLEHLKNEAEGILFSLAAKQVDFQQLLRDIRWDHCSVSFVAKNDFPLGALINYISEKNYSYGNLQGVIFWKDKVLLPPALPSSNGLRFAGIVIEAATPVEEITKALESGVGTIEAFVQNGNTAEEIFKHIAFSIPLDTQLLINISKLKALRILWYQVAQAYGVRDYKISDLHIHGRSEKWVNPKFQPHGNMLKSTLASIAGISGGANSITIQPEENDHVMMARIARNTSIILREESHLGKVKDPFAGAYGIEIMTDRIAKDAWSSFQSKQ